MSLNHEMHAKAINPLQHTLTTKLNLQSCCEGSEMTNDSASFGAPQQPATQCAPLLSSAVSSYSTKKDAANVQTLLDANRTQRFYKSLEFISLPWRQVCGTCVYLASPTPTRFLARWLQSRRFRCWSHSQAGPWWKGVGHHSFCSTREAKRLNRTKRSSINSELHAASACVDSIEWAKSSLALLGDTDLDPRDEDTTKQVCPYALVVDARALFDATQKTSVAKFSVKRTGIYGKAGANATFWHDLVMGLQRLYCICDHNGFMSFEIALLSNNILCNL